MCGILGTVNIPFDESVLNLLQHRGPDDAGLSADRVGAHTVRLGHRRLSILDLSPAGHQPMWTRCGRFGIVFNGEIYNHGDLRTPRIQYAGHSDTETVLHHLAENGPDAARDLNGIFAIALLDTQSEKLFLLRDPFGVKPLYYSAGPAAFSFSSELRPLRKLVGDDLDLDSLAELLRLRYLPAPDTLHRNICKLRPGHILEVRLSGAALKYRTYPFALRQQTPEPKLNAAPEYQRLVDQAVRRQLLSDVEVGMLLSGGVDSALIATIARRHSGYRMKAFTVGFEGDSPADEITDARETAAAADMEHHEVRIGRRQFFDLLPVITSVVEEPLATTSVVPMYALAGLAASHVKVVLSGQGADEAMGGYRRYRGEVIRELLPTPALALLRNAAMFFAAKSEAVQRGGDSLGIRDDVQRFESVYGVFSPDEIQRLIGYAPGRAAERIRYFFDTLGCRLQAQSVERMMTLDLRMNLADDLLLYTDKITMRHSLECRVPFLDLDLVRFVEALPRRHRVGVFRGKILHKKVAGRVLPRSIVARPKKGFLSPTAEWFRQSPATRDILLSRTSRFSSVFDLDAVETLLNQHSAGMNRERHIFLLLGIHHWLERCHGQESGSLMNTPAVPSSLA